MANELQTDYLTGLTVYFLVRNSVGQIWNTATPGFENYTTANYAHYPITGTEQGTASAFYVGNMVAAATGVYSVVAKQQIGGSPAESDPSAGGGTLYWDGSNSVIPFLPPNFGTLSVNSSGRAAVQTGFTKNVAVPNFEFKMFQTDGKTPATGLTITATRSIDGGAFAACANTASEVSKGVYSINLAASDLNGGVITFNFDGGATALVADITVRTDP